jgi:hypothetical protein
MLKVGEHVPEYQAHTTWSLEVEKIRSPVHICQPRALSMQIAGYRTNHLCCT